MEELTFSPQMNVGRRLGRVKEFSHEGFYDELSREVLQFIKETLEARFLQVQKELVCCERYDRSADREGYRHGFYERSWTTRMGSIRALRIPRIRGRGGVVGALIRRYQRREALVDEVLLDSFIHGLSVRQACRVLEKLNGIKVSPTTVSRVFKEMDHEVGAFHTRVLRDCYRYLVLDGIEVSVFIGGVSKRQVLCALGITEDGREELLGFLPASSESEASWLSLLSDLWKRGLKGEALKLITADGAGGIWAAVGQVYPNVETQSCSFHKMCNATDRLKRRANRKRLCSEMAEVYEASSAEGAYRRLREFSARWRRSEPYAVRVLCDGFEKTLGFFTVPREDRQKVRTTNILERFYEEVRRRLGPMRVLPNTRSLERNFYARVALFNNKRMEEHPVKILQFTQNS